MDATRSHLPAPPPAEHISSEDCEGSQSGGVHPFIAHVDPPRYDSRGGQLCIDVTVYYRTDRGLDSCEVTFFDGDVKVSADEYEHPRTDEARDRYWLIVEAAETVRDGGIWASDFPLDAVNAEIVIASAAVMP